MKQLKEHIKKVVSQLIAEEKYAAPQEISDALKMTLKLDPLVRYVDTLKAANTLPPSYEVRLLNGTSFMIYYEEFGLMVKIGTKDYYLNDAKDQCKKTIEKKKIIHMIIENYRIDNNNYSYFPEKLKCDSITLDIKLTS